ncbi:hypothetical protein F5Y17DRAFT_428821 [Xylariaceae sp. FL0594]|nr:hypothetical protein F5Y17DRAFT_428821 [Xylariaceae sp. FL0594]
MRWLLRRVSRTGVRPLQPLLKFRQLSTFVPSFHNAERVNVPVGSSGSVTIDLYNLGKVSSSEPLLIYLPPFSTSAEAHSSDLSELPRFTYNLATAVINYRWTEESSGDQRLDDGASESDDELPLRRFHPGWPAPLHDTMKAYTWITDNLKPPTYARRDIYVCGSYLGASLATSLALTESHPHERMAVRGCVAYNGIYNWTTFLPDHPINKLDASATRNFLDEILSMPEDPNFQELRQMISELFNQPQDLFDPFVSPCLFFHTPNLLIPPSFDSSALSSESSLEDLDFGWAAGEGTEPVVPLRQPRKSPLVFPPRKSTLKIPEMLLLHDGAPPSRPSWMRRGQRRKKERPGNNFWSQAVELASLMRRSINMVELKERMKWDEDMDYSSDEACRRVQVEDVGRTGRPDQSEYATANWLEEQISNRA